jgi:hypothetical protein
VLWVALPHTAVIWAIALWVLGLGLAWIRLGPRGARALSVITASWLAIVGVVAVAAHQHHANTAAAPFGSRPTWIDDAVPPGEVVPVLWDQRQASTDAPDADYYPLMVTAVLNRSVGEVLRLGGPTYYENVLPTTRVTVGRDRSLRDERGTIVRSRFVLVPCSLTVAGRDVARSGDGRFAIVRTDGAVKRVEARVCGPRAT